MVMENAVNMPEKFKYGEDFDLFFRQFCTFAKIVNVGQAQQYNLILSFLDKKSFRIVEGIQLNYTDKADINVAFPKLKKALTVSAIPASIELRFRKQLESESLNDFGYVIQCLGFTAYGPDCLQHSSVIDAFCMGVRSAELSAKLLSKNFESFSEALSFATNVDSAARVKHFVVQNRKAVSKPQQEAQTQTEAEATAYKGMVGNEVNSLDISETERNNLLDSRNGKNVPISKFTEKRKRRCCFYCGMENHLIKFCYKRMANEKKGGELAILDHGVVTEKPKTLGVANSGNNTTRFSTAFILIKISNKNCYALVDTGASVSICCKSVLPPDVELIRENCLRIRGVSGKDLKVLGKASINCVIGGKCVSINAHVVENLADSTFIIGRDVLEAYGCVIDYRNLTFTIDGFTLPLLKSYKGNQLKYPSLLHCNRTTIIAPHSSKVLDCHMKTKSSKRLFMTMTGAIEISQDTMNSLKLSARDTLVNSNRGKVSLLVENYTDNPVCIYRNKKLAKFSTFHPVEINSLNIAAAQCYANYNESKTHGSDYSSAERPSENNHNSRSRWQNNIGDLYSLLEINELVQVSEAQRSEIKNLVHQFRDIFAENDDDMGCTDMAEQEIILKDNIPVRSKYYNIPLALKSKAEKEVKRLMDLRIIEPSTSTWHSPSFVMAKSDGSLRLLTDFRSLNAKMLRTYAPVPALQDLVALWNNCTLYSTLDFQKGFFQTALKPESREFTATSLPGIAFFQYRRSPMGLSSSPGFFQSLVEKMLMGLKQSQCVAFLDDIMSGSKTFEGMIENLRAIFLRIRDSKMLLNSKKCKLFKKSIQYLGHIISKNGVATCPEKIEAIEKMAPPKNIKGVRSFLGLSGFYRRFVKNYAKIVEPLSRMTRKNSKFDWNSEANNAWQTVKDMLSKNPILVHPDTSKQYTLITDASSYAIGGILTQKGDDGHLHPVSYGSAILTDAQRRWSTVQRELYSLVYFCEKFEIYLLNTHFHVITDNTALLHLERFKNIKTNRLWRWFETLQKYDFSISYSPSKQNPSDALSRLPKVDDALIDTLPACAEVDRTGGTMNIVNTVVSVIDKIDIPVKTAVPGHNQDVSQPVNKDSWSRPVMQFSNARIQKAQDEDSVMHTVKSWLDGSTLKPTSSYNLQGDLYTFYHSFDRLKIIDGVICRKWEKNSNEKPLYLACLPLLLQEKVISAAHDPPASGHLGVDKSLDRIRTAYYFPKMAIKVKLQLGKCLVCHKKSRNQKKLKAPLTPFSGTAPGEIVFMDLMENLPVVNGFKSILIIIDSFTKWCECIPLRSTQAEYVARALLNCWISRQGCPSQLHSDRGGNVETAEILKALYKMMGITKTANIAYRPQTDGTAERMVGTLKGMLWKYSQENPRNWANSLDQVLFAYRTALHSATGFSPFFLDKGRLPRLPLHVLMGTDIKNVLGDNYSQAAYELFHRLQNAYLAAHESIRSKQESSKKRYDAKINVQSFVEGEY